MIKINCIHPVSHDNIIFERGFHTMPDDLAAELLRNCTQAVAPCDINESGAIGRIRLAISQSEIERQLSERIARCEIAQDDVMAARLRWQFRCATTLASFYTAPVTNKPTSDNATPKDEIKMWLDSGEREKAVDLWKRTTNRAKTKLYQEAGVDKSDFYKWCKGEKIAEESVITTRLRQILLT